MHVRTLSIWTALIFLSPAVLAADLKINIIGEMEQGEIICGLFDSKEGFPSNPAPQNKQLIPASKAVTCIFRDLPPGKYAVAIMNDLNGNGYLDKNVFGVPKEPWGVSNDIRHSMREPKFEEAVINFDIDTNITVRIDK